MKLTKTKYVWRTEKVTECDVMQGSQRHHKVYTGNVGVARIFNLAEKEFGEGITITNIRPSEQVFYMELSEFKKLAKFINKADIDQEERKQP